MLEVNGVGKCYRIGSKFKQEIWALRDVTFSVPAGTILGVIGPNGAGKTTLLKIISRVTRPTTGKVTGHGRLIPLLSLGAGFQPDLSGRENILMNAAMYGVSAAQVEERMDEIIDFAGVREFIDLGLKRYSSGMSLRLAFSVAINLQPDILLADEVLAVGDLEFQERCLERVQQAGDAGMTVLFVSHDMEALRRLCHQVLWLDTGEVVDIGPPDAITSAYQDSAWSLANQSRKKKKGGGGVSVGGDVVFARLMAQGHEIGAARTSDSVEVEVGLQITAAPVRMLPRIDVKTQGTLAFRSLAPDWIEVAEPGLYTATITIPPDLLAQTVYTIDVGVDVLRGNESMPVIMYNALTFPVHDTSEHESARGRYKRNYVGAVRPKLEWTVRPTQQHVAQAQHA